MKSTNPDTPCVIPIHMLGNGLIKMPEKNTKIRPENIKKDINMLGITGTYEGQQQNRKIEEHI